IGARTPQEIAISIVASITAQRESIAVTTKRPSKPFEAQSATTPDDAVETEVREATGTEGKSSRCHD
ncbi:MAG: hypothetical protein KJN97_19125, partial [Deltaproteobacteria bacterium]|nr:hypothetical protein [Deltaproteobacteria bacterium]